MPSFSQASDVPGLVFGVPTGYTPAQMLALGNANANAIGAVKAAMQSAGLKRLTLGARDIVLANQTSPAFNGRQPLYSANDDEFFFELDGTRILMAGTDRLTVGGVAQFEQNTGASGFMGAGSIDYIYPQIMPGFVSQIVNSTSFVVTLDDAITWSDFSQVMVYDPVLDGFTSRPAYSTQQSAAQAGIPITLATGSQQVTGYDYLVDCSTSATAFYNPALIALGGDLCFLHYNGANAISGVNAEKIVLPPELRIYASPNAVFYGVNTSLDADCHCEPKFITSKIASRGRFRRRAVAAGGFLFTPSELSSTLCPTIIGTFDDGIDVAAFTTSVVSVDSSTQITAAGQSDAMPKAGQRVSLLDANRLEQAVMIVKSSARVAGSPAGAAGNTQLVFTKSLPTGVTTSWSISPVTTSRGVLFKAGTRIETTGSAGIRISAQVSRIQDALISRTMGPGIEFSDAGASEYAPAKSLSIGHATLDRVNTAQGFEPIAALVVRPRNAADTAALPAGAYGDVDIASLDVIGGTNGPAAAISSCATLRIGKVLCEKLNAAPTAIGNHPTGCSLDLENIATVMIDALTELEKPGASILNTVGIGTMILGEDVGVVVPTSGVATLSAYGKDIPYVPTITPASGAFPTGSAVTPNNVRFRMDRNKNWEMKGRFDIPANLGTAAGPLTFTSPVTLSSVDWETGTITDEQHRAGQWDMSAGPSSTTFSVYQIGNAGVLVAGAALFFRIGGEAA